MDDYTFKPTYDAEKTNNGFIAPTNSFPDSFDPTKATIKFESLTNPPYGAHEFRKPRLNSFENFAAFFPFAKEEDHFPDVQNFPKPEAMVHDYPHFAVPQPQMDIGFENYRINRSRGPSFNIGTGRKVSDDLFGGNFDLLNYFRAHEQPRARTFSYELFDMPGFPNMADSNFQFGFPAAMENAMDMALNVLAQNAQNVQNIQPQPIQEQPIEHTQRNTDLEPKVNKKRKLNNAQDVPAGEDEMSTTPQFQKAKSENKKEVQSTQLKASKSTVQNPNTKKAAGSKGKKAGKGASAAFNVKAEIEEHVEKATQASSYNVSPDPKKESLPGALKSGAPNAFGQFKKPETAQDLLGGLQLPAEVEEYINNSKIFNQIRAPVAKKIGTLTLEERKAKIEKYLEKRKKRSFNKRVSYDCRKKVADNRLRIKGRFVTRDQAFVMMDSLGIHPDPETITNAEIKAILMQKFGGVTRRKKENAAASDVNNGNEEKNTKIEEGMNNPLFWNGEQGNSEFGSEDDLENETF